MALRLRALRVVDAMAFGLAFHVAAAGQEMTVIKPPPAGMPPPLPKVLTCPTPEYPAVALRAEAQGTTKIDVEVDEQGDVVNAFVSSASGDSRPHQYLDRSALEAMRKCKFNQAPGVPLRKSRIGYTFSVGPSLNPVGGQK